MGVSTTRTLAPRVLLIELPQGWSVRLAVERELRRRGCPLVSSPAAADAIVVCGRSDAMTDVMLEAAARLLPHPVQPVRLMSATDLGAALEQLRAMPPLPDGPAGHDMDGHDMGGQEMTGHDMSGHDDDMMDMSGPGGVALAAGEDDRDGLSMDVLHVPLGPVTTLWPAGVAVETSLQGDVLTAVRVQISPGPERLEPAQRPAFSLDAAAQILDLAGAATGAARLRAVRDAVLDGADPADRSLAEWRRLRRDALLRWSLRGLGTVRNNTDLPDGDVWGRLLRLVHFAAEPVVRHDRLDEVAAAAVLGDLIRGLDVAAARLVIASVVPFLRLVDPDGDPG